MADVEDLFQAKNATVLEVTAPLLAEYPTGYVDSPKLPMALTWVIDTTLDSTAGARTSEVQIDVLIGHPGRDTFPRIKLTCKEYRDALMTEYHATQGNNDYLAEGVQIVPGTVVVSGFRDLVEAPDETLFHGFILTFQIRENLDGGCT